ncbi:unnamed protein product, partial [Ceratitis capitata]
RKRTHIFQVQNMANGTKGTGKLCRASVCGQHRSCHISNEANWKNIADHVENILRKIGQLWSPTLKLYESSSGVSDGSSEESFLVACKWYITLM